MYINKYVYMYITLFPFPNLPCSPLVLVVRNCPNGLLAHGALKGVSGSLIMMRVWYHTSTHS